MMSAQPYTHRAIEHFRQVYISLHCRRKNSPFGLRQFALRPFRFDKTCYRKYSNSRSE